VVDIFGTPFAEALHVVERIRLIDNQGAKDALARGERENLRVAGEGGGGIDVDVFSAQPITPTPNRL
jgi:hypothetical protein